MMLSAALQAWSLPVAVVLAALLAWRLPSATVERTRITWLEGPWLPGLAALFSVAIVVYAWGSLFPVTFIHDEASYLLEAQTLAQGHFTGAARPLPEFFEQYHVFVEPVLASRYPAGWPLALVPGVWLGIPILVPLLLTAATAALLVLLVRRAAGAPAALLAWLVWIGPPISLRFRPTFLSQHLSTFCWVLGLWALWRWRDDRRARWLVLLSVVTAWQGITRPVTAIAFALPVAALVVIDLIRHRAWRAGALALVAGLAVVAILPFPNRAVTGRWARLPMEEYSLRFAPYDLPGFGLDTRKPEAPPSAHQKAYDEGFRPRHADHVPERLPQILEIRLRQFVGQSAGPWGAVGLAALAVAGLILGGAPMALAGLTGASLFVCYLWFAHPEQWVAYYMEAHLVLAAAVAIGVARCAAGVLRVADRGGPEPRTDGGTRIALAVLVVAGVVALRLPPGIGLAREAHESLARPHRFLSEIERQLPAGSILFIRYAPDHHIDRGLVENRYDLAGTPVWRVHDLGVRNEALLRSAPGRIPYLLDEANWTVYRLAPDGVTLRPFSVAPN